MWLAAIGLAGASGAAVPACLAGGPPLDPITNEGGADEGDADPPDAALDAPVSEPHAVIGANPSHGPFHGGDRVIVRGNGFSSDVRVWFGEVEATEVVAVDATRVQVTAPPGERGPVDLSTQNGDDESTHRTLAGGYAYDALYAEPSTGPISGGTEVRIVGQGTSWDDTSEAFIDDEACTSLTVTSPTEILCVAPKGTPGAKSVRVESDETITVLEAYTYEDSVDGFKGGLSGSPLDGSLRVLVYNNYTGEAIPGAFVVAGSNIETGLVAQVDETGVVVLEDASLSGAVTVSVGALCHSPVSFVDVPVDTVTVYLDPILTPSCAKNGDPPGVGTGGVTAGYVKGEIVFPSTTEFQRGPFLVPAPIGTEKATAYIFSANSNPLARFTLPSASVAITADSEGTIGYGFNLASVPGNRTYYAIAGLEDRTKNPATFVAYSIGVVRGVPVFGGQTTSEVYLTMTPLDLALTIEADPPPPGSSGPDRLLTTAAVRLGADGYAILPAGQKAPLLPLSNDVTFVGLPLLADSLQGATYVASSRAVTGPSFLAPMSVVSSVQATTTAFPLVMGEFVGLPELTTPELNATWNGKNLETQFGPGGPVDLTVYDVVSGNGLVHWTVAVPGGARAIELPDLRTLEGAGLPSGAVTIAVYGARIDAFDYAKLRYRHLRPAGMSAYSLDYVQAHLP